AEDDPSAFNVDDGVAVEAEAISDRPTVEELEERLRLAEEKLAEAERQARDLSERFRSARNQLQIEADEQRQRLQRSFDQRLEAARGDIVAGLLDTLDNLQRAIGAAEDGTRHEADFDALLGGVRATFQLFEAKMQSLGLVRISSQGEDFNPELHEAVELVPVEPELDSKVIEEYQSGFRFGERLIRPARVRVGRSG
ncbi:MAG: nucleotide exchange factor GrpE, partial [Acidobacteria bacterium]|nr:nucleotide exchange factor GrpE [Acidobacteriota bacterium]